MGKWRTAQISKQLINVSSEFCTGHVFELLRAIDVSTRRSDYSFSIRRMWRRIDSLYHGVRTTVRLRARKIKNFSEFVYFFFSVVTEFFFPFMIVALLLLGGCCFLHLQNG